MEKLKNILTKSIKKASNDMIDNELTFIVKKKMNVLTVKIVLLILSQKKENLEMRNLYMKLYIK